MARGIRLKRSKLMDSGETQQSGPLARLLIDRQAVVAGRGRRSPQWIALGIHLTVWSVMVAGLVSISSEPWWTDLLDGVILAIIPAFITWVLMLNWWGRRTWYRSLQAMGPNMSEATFVRNQVSTSSKRPQRPVLSRVPTRSDKAVPSHRLKATRQRVQPQPGTRIRPEDVHQRIASMESEPSTEK